MPALAWASVRRMTPGASVQNDGLERHQAQPEEAVDDAEQDCLEWTIVCAPTADKAPQDKLETAHYERHGQGRSVSQQARPPEKQNDRRSKSRFDERPLGASNAENETRCQPRSFVNSFSGDLRPDVRQPENAHRREERKSAFG